MAGAAYGFDNRAAKHVPIRRVAAGPGYDITILRGTVPMLQKFTRSEPMIDGKKYPPSNTSRKPPANTLAFLPDIGVDAGVGDAFAIVTFSMLTFSALTGIARRTSGSFVAGASSAREVDSGGS
jgi:hypothetical protein